MSDSSAVHGVGGWLILPGFLIDIPGEPPRRGWGIRVTGDRIADVGPHADLIARYPDDERWEAPDCALSPGFVNAHTHLYGVLAHGIPPDAAPEGFRPFLTDFWWPRVEDRLDQEMLRAATDSMCCQMLHSGVTSFYDCTEAPYSLPGPLAAQAAAVAARGMRATLSFEATERVSRENGQLGLQENVQFIERCRAGEWGPLIRGMMCFHTSFTCSAELIRQALDLAVEHGALLHMHLSEGGYEPEYALAHFGMRPVHYYRRLGVLGPAMLASQCVQIDAEEVALLAESRASVVHMPLSNCEVGGGIAPIPDLLAAGATVGLGSDSYVDDFFAVMRGAFLIHKAHRRDPRVMPAATVWRMATEGGARALALQDVGRLTPGWQADLQLIDARFPTPATAANLYDQLLLYRSPAHVRAVVVAGRVLLRDGILKGVDEPAVIARTHRAAERLWRG